MTNINHTARIEPILNTYQKPLIDQIDPIQKRSVMMMLMTTAGLVYTCVGVGIVILARKGDCTTTD